MEPTPLFSSPDHQEAKLKNSFALIVLLAGLFVGSLFVDIGQLITGSGFSGSALRDQNILETGGKTWVAYTEPAINVSVVNDDACIECAPDEALLWMKRIFPTLNAKKVAYDSFEGKELAMKHGFHSIPAFIFESGIETTDFFAEAAPLFHEQDGRYFFDINKIGLPVGKYLVAPEYTEGDIRLGKSDAPTVVTVFSDFACEYCKEYHATFKELIKIYGNRVAFIFKHFPLPNHPQAERAALAASCAQSQGFFLPYTDLLFAKQADWTKRADSTTTLKNYAWQVKGMNGRDFARCMDEKRFAAVVTANQELGTRFDLQAAPVTFIGNDFVSGAIPLDELRTILDQKLGQEE